MEVTINKEEKLNLTEEDFKDYEEVREGGLTNMFDVRRVVELSDNLTEEKVKAIMNNYEALIKEFPNVRN